MTHVIFIFRVKRKTIWERRLDILPALKDGDSQFTEPNLATLTCRQDLQTLQGLTPPVRRPKHYALR